MLQAHTTVPCSMIACTCSSDSAAIVDDPEPPSGTVYNPDGSGALASLGVHEHWNDATARKYSRNLGRKEGIELIAQV